MLRGSPGVQEPTDRDAYEAARERRCGPRTVRTLGPAIPHRPRNARPAVRGGDSMTSPLVPLPPPDSFDQSSSMWVDEAMWGHRLYDEQSPWMVFLEFLNVFHHEWSKGRAFEESNGANTLKYQAAQRLHLRNILFNDPYLAEVRSEYAHDTNRWDEWLK